MLFHFLTLTKSSKPSHLPNPVISHKKFQSVANTQSSKRIDLTVANTKSIALPLPNLTIANSLLVGLSRRFSSQQFVPHRCRSVATLQLATIRASPSSIRFLPVRRNASARNSSRLTVTDSLLTDLLRCFNSQRFTPHRLRFASRRSVARFQLTTVRTSLSPIRFSPVRRDALAHNGLRLTIADLLLAGLSRCFRSQQFAPHCSQFTSRQFVVMLQLATVSFALSAMILATL